MIVRICRQTTDGEKIENHDQQARFPTNTLHTGQRWLKVTIDENAVLSCQPTHATEDQPKTNRY